MSRLWAEFLNNRGRIVHKWKHYFPAYEQHFSRFVNRPVTFLEIGCGEGGSLQMWKRYLGPHAQIVGIDVRPECSQYQEDQIAIRIGSQDDTAFLQSVLEEFGTPNVVLDDGSHIMHHVVSTFQFLYPRTATDGVYFVEDLHTAYFPDYGGGFERDGTFIELCKKLVDSLNGHWSGRSDEFTSSTMSMHFYDSIVAFERGRMPQRNNFQIGQAAGSDEQVLRSSLILPQA